MEKTIKDATFFGNVLVEGHVRVEGDLAVMGKITCVETGYESHGKDVTTVNYNDMKQMLHSLRSTLEAWRFNGLPTEDEVANRIIYYGVSS